MTIKKQENRDEITLRTATDGAEIFDATFHVIKTRAHFERVARSYIDDNGDVCDDCHIYFTTSDGRDVLCSEGEHVQVSLLRYAINGEIGTADDEFIFGTGARFVIDDDALWISYDGDKDGREPVGIDALDAWTDDDEKRDVEARKAAYIRYMHTAYVWVKGHVVRTVHDVERVTVHRVKHVEGYMQDVSAVIEYTDGSCEKIELDPSMWIECNDRSIKEYFDKYEDKKPLLSEKTSSDIGCILAYHMGECNRLDNENPGRFPNSKHDHMLQGAFEIIRTLVLRESHFAFDFCGLYEDGKYKRVTVDGISWDVVQQ